MWTPAPSTLLLMFWLCPKLHGVQSLRLTSKLQDKQPTNPSDFTAWWDSCDPSLNKCDSNTTAFSSLLARRPILTRWKDPRPPTFGSGLETWWATLEKIRFTIRGCAGKFHASWQPFIGYVEIMSACDDYVVLDVYSPVPHCLTCLQFCAYPEYISVFDFLFLREIWSHGEGSGGSNAVRLPAYVYLRMFMCLTAGKIIKNSWIKKKMSAPMLNPPTESHLDLSADHKPDLVICPLLLSRFILCDCNSTYTGPGPGPSNTHTHRDTDTHIKSCTTTNQKLKQLNQTALPTCSGVGSTCAAGTL